MAVFTEVSADDAHALLQRIGAGGLIALTPIASGIENTNYFVDADSGGWVLTVFERMGFDQLPFYLRLMQHLAAAGLPVPAPKADAAGEIVHTLRGKPAALVQRLPGAHQLAPDLHHVAQLGQVLARMHEAAQSFTLQQPNLRGLAWWNDTVPVVLPHLAAPQQALMHDELAFQRALAASPSHAQLPRGPVHADLFRDNALFDGLPGHERLTGVFDFYFAAVDALLFDIAVCLNDWCVDLDSGRLDEPRAAALVAAYETVRPLQGVERRLLPGLMRAAAFRFWLSRAWDIALPRSAAVLHPKDPAHFERILQERIAQPWHP
jgi:homoserine kinase type II